MSNLKLLNLDRHIQSSLDAIDLLYLHRHFQEAKYCAFILIDQMAWLVSEHENEVNKYFKLWLGRYFVQYYPEISVDEIWASRNAHLHRASSISKSMENSNNTDKQLWFIDDMETQEQIDHLDYDPKEMIFHIVNTKRFIDFSLKKAIKLFKEDIENGKYIHTDTFNFRLGRILQPISIDQF